MALETGSAAELETLDAADLNAAAPSGRAVAGAKPATADTAPSKVAAAHSPISGGQDWQARSDAVTGALSRWWATQPLPRWLGGSLGRRILFANLSGLFGLFLAMLYLSLHHGWLLDAKIDVVKTVSRITAEAIAYRAVNERAVFDANRLPDRAPQRPRRDDAFAALELPVEPHLVTVVLRKLVGPTDLTARVYSNTGTLIVDSDTLFSTGASIPDASSNAADENAGSDLPLKNFWTRFHYWLNNRELKVYRDLGTANGFLYPEVKKAAQEGVEAPILLLNKSGEQIVALAEPIKRGNRVLGVLLVSTKPGEIDAVLWDERWLLFQIAVIALLVAIASSVLLTRTVAGPMTRLARAARGVSQNTKTQEDLPDFSERRDEVGQMGRAFVAMTKALYRRIEASEKFAADVAHELKNPLAAARSMAESLQYARDDEQRAQLVTEITRELKRLNRLINDVSAASRLDAELARQRMQPVDVRSVLSSVEQIFSEMLSDDTRKLKFERSGAEASAAAYTVLGNDGRLGQVITNLIDNALSFSPDGGVVTIRTRPRPGQIEIAVEDEGPGIPDDKLDAIFDRFYSDRPQTDTHRGKNSGLGLSISREIIISHHGEILAENKRHDGVSPGGARFVIRLPLSPNGESHDAKS
jgi:two-component system, OmpR family, sensor histidine kinase ChvG